MAVDYAALKAGGFMRQKQKNTFSLRLRVVGGNVTTDQLVAIQNVANTYGNGYIHLTSRQGIEIPFIKLEDIDAVKAALAEGGVVPGVCGPRVRTVTACQGGVCCPSGCINALEIAEDLDARYFGRELPHKFKFGVTGCQNNCLKAEENDVGVKGGYEVSWKKDSCIFCGLCVKVCRQNALVIENGEVKLTPEKCNHCGRCVKSCPTDSWDYTEGFLVSFGGTFGNNIVRGKEIIPLVTDKETLYKVTDAAIEFFAENAEPGERFAKTLDRVGWEGLETGVRAAYAEGVSAHNGEGDSSDGAEPQTSNASGEAVATVTAADGTVYEVTDTVDITTVVCPVTFVKAKVALEELEDGDVLTVHMNDGEPVQNVPRSIKEEGHQILGLHDNEDGTYDLYVKKVEE